MLTLLVRLCVGSTVPEENALISEHVGLSDAYAEKVSNDSKRLDQVGGLYKRLTPAILELLVTRDTSYTLKNNSKPSKEQIDHILRFSTCLVSVSARLALE